MNNWRYCRPTRKRKPRAEDMEMMRQFLERTGIKVVSEEEAEEADVVVCNTSDMWTPFRDNVSTVCAECGKGIYHRPHAPRKPRKICLNCAAEMSEREARERNSKN